MVQQGGAKGTVCTCFERSAFQVLKALSTNNPTTVAKIYSTLGREALKLHLGAGNNVPRFVAALEFEGFLREMDGAYKLTKEGLSMKEKLSQLVACAQAPSPTAPQLP